MKIQTNALPTGAASLEFGDIVPKDTSTRHVAAAAFYHCLGELQQAGIIRSWKLKSL